MAKSLKVAFLLYDGCTLLDFVGATQVFTQWAAGWQPMWVSKERGPVTTSEGFSVNATNSIFRSNGDLDKNVVADIVFVPGGDGAGLAVAMQDTDYLGWLKAQSEHEGCWVGAVCVGTFLLASADVLSGSEVTTHWLLIDQLQRLQGQCGFKVVSGYPRSKIDRETKRFSGGGVSSSIDLALALVAELDSVEKANEAALIIQYDPELPKCIEPRGQSVKPGSPDKTAPAALKAIVDNINVQNKFVGEIRTAVDDQLK